MGNTKLAKIKYKFNDSLLFGISLIMIFSAFIYYIYALNWTGVIISLILASTVFIFSRRLFAGKSFTEDEKYNEAQSKKSLLDSRTLLFISGYLISYSLLIVELIKARTDRALISPWEVVNNSFFWLYLLSSLILVGILLKKQLGRTVKIFFIFLHYLISFSVAAIIYKIGYGFDPFIHQATMELIAEKGFVLPKPLYYLGQYGFIIIFHKITGLTIALINKLLVPVLTALFLPPALMNFLNYERRLADSNHKTAKAAFLTVLFLLILTFSPFILTTPQNLSYLFLILSVLNGLTGGKPFKVLILAIATTAIHPLTGLPALSWAAWVYLNKYRARLKPLTIKISQGIIFIFTVLSLPLALFYANGHTFTVNNFWSSILSPLKDLFHNLSSAGRENWILNFVYFIFDNYPILVILGIIASLLYFYRHNAENKPKKLLVNGLLIINFALFIAYLLINRIDFAGLIGYEQGDYAARLLIIMLLFFLPFIALGAEDLINRILKENHFIRISWLIFGASLLLISLYISYPRFDKYFNSHGYSTSAADIKAVQLTDQKASSSYIVLANQQVSAAALSIFGFDHYYKTPAGEIYFYPVPTGGPLYNYYLDMVYKNPGRTIALKAMDLAGVNEAYLIVNKYWYQSGRIINEAKLLADKWWLVDDQVYIFEYKR